MLQLTTCKVAVSEPQSILRRGLMDVLNNYGINVAIEVKNNSDLIKKLSYKDPVPDICIMDVPVHEKNNYETLEYINKQWPEIKILAFTSAIHEFGIIKLIGNGAAGYIAKGCEPAELISALSEICNYGIYYSPKHLQQLLKLRNNNEEMKKFTFSGKEIEFINLCCTELTYKEIANRMHLSLSRINDFSNTLFIKLNLKSRIGLVIFAISAGIVVLKD